MLEKRPLAEGCDVLLIGSGIMSATLGMMLKELDPTLTIHVVERLEAPAEESSAAWNNAGTGHAALCELNYTPEKAGSIDIAKAIAIDEQFEQSKQFWAYLVEEHRLDNPRAFITSVPHMSFVRGDEDVAFLKKRFEALTKSHLFRDMAFSEDPSVIAGWAPLLMEGRKSDEKVAATRSMLGTDLNFGALTRGLFAALQAMDGVHLHLRHEVRGIRRRDDGLWGIDVVDLTSGDEHAWKTSFCFIGAGGAALTLLSMSGIPEADGYGGFPVSGQWLRCNNPELVARHDAKVYGKAKEGSPPMSVPHLDARTIDGERAMLFGPFAGFSTKFLKHGSYMDLPASLELDNLVPMIDAGWDNRELTKYLLEQVRLSPAERVECLREYLPTAKAEDWELAVAGQRVQVIKRDPEGGGVLEFGTEVVSSADGSLAALLGASPGASTAVSIMLQLVHRCMGERAKTDAWKAKLKKMVPSFGRSMADDPELTRAVRVWSHGVLELLPPDTPA